jgi:predicted component of type VI protein secretion system
MTVETIEKRERRLKLERNKFRRTQHALRYMEPPTAFSHILGFTSTWDAVRRVAEALIRCPVKDVMVAWQIIYYVHNLADGKERLRVATDEAMALWEREVEG